MATTRLTRSSSPRARLAGTAATLAALFISTVLLAGCGEPQVGTKAWCEMMDKKPKGDWTANQAGDYAKSCVFGTPKS
jgi:hypothetical protein